MKHERLGGPSRARELRRSVDLFAYVRCEGGELSQVTIVDLSYDGCQIETPVFISEGSIVELSISGLGCHRATVRWYRSGRAGLTFAKLKYTEKQHVPRSHERIELAAEISLRRVGRKGYQARVFDLSSHGCRVEFIERPRPGELVWVKFPSLDAIEAKACWIDGFYGGVEFLRPIHPAVFDLLIARLLADQQG